KNTSTQQKTYNEKPPLTPPRPPITPPKEGNYSPPSEGSGVVSYRLAKRSTVRTMNSGTQDRKNLIFDR
ncbi:MAG: hypothetical protein LBC74_09720, partial [Planctomycetaceae bacterium]|nr:hypothetical protein [Planctomycetaceae bacterium]